MSDLIAHARARRPLPIMWKLVEMRTPPISQEARNLYADQIDAIDRALRDGPSDE